MTDDARDDTREPQKGTEPSETDVDQPAMGDNPDSDSDRSSDDELARIRKALAKANREAAQNRKKLSEYEDRDKTEAQRLSERAEQAEKRASTAESKLLRLEVAARKGLPAQLATRLQGDSEEELEQDADSLLELVGTKREQPKPTRQRDPDQGRGNGQVANDDTDMNDWLRRAAGVRAE